MINRIAILASCAFLLAACEEKNTEATTNPRPVLTTVAVETRSAGPVFAGTVEARVEAEQAFLVLGRIVSRPVDIGDRVSRGQLLASLDPLSLELAVSSAEAQLASSRASLENAATSLQRQQELFSTKTTTEAALEEARQAHEAAEASVRQAEASLVKAQEQRSYANLTASFDGVVREVSAEVGQTVSAGQPVVTLAELGAKDVVLDAPDTAFGTIRVGAPFAVRLQMSEDVQAVAHVREITPSADPLTRTRRVKLTLENPPEAFRLGSTVTAVSSFEQPGEIRLPAQAVLRREGEEPRIWVVDEKASKVASMKVELGQGSGGSVSVKSGIQAGTRVVVAGVNSLEEGQSVRIEQDDEHE